MFLGTSDAFLGFVATTGHLSGGRKRRYPPCRSSSVARRVWREDASGTGLSGREASPSLPSPPLDTSPLGLPLHLTL